MPIKKKGRGGARAGAGRKASDGAVIAGVVTLYVDQDTIDVMAELGNGNDSLGIRLAIAELLSLRSSTTAPPAKRELKSIAPEPEPAVTMPVNRNPFMRR